MSVALDFLLPAELSSEDRRDIVCGFLDGDMNDAPAWFKTYLEARVVADFFRMSVPEVLAMPEESRARALGVARLENDADELRRTMEMQRASARVSGAIGAPRREGGE